MVRRGRLHTYFGLLLLLCLISVPTIASPAKSLRVAAIMVEENNLFWEEVWKGVRFSAVENDVLLSEYPFSHGSSSDIAWLLDIATLAQVDGIILRAQDIPSDSLLASLTLAMERGIRIITIDVDAKIRDMFVGIDNDAAAALLAAEAAHRVSSGERIAIIKSDANIATVDARIFAFLRALSGEIGDVEYDIFEYSNPGNTAAQTIQTYLKENPDIRVIFAGGPIPLHASALAITRMDEDFAFTLLGFYENEFFLQEIGSEMDVYLIKQDPFAMGKQAMEDMVALLEGNAMKRDTFLLPVTLLSVGDEIL